MRDFFFSVIFVVKISKKLKKKILDEKKNEYVGMAPKP